MNHKLHKRRTAARTGRKRLNTRSRFARKENLAFEPLESRALLAGDIASVNFTSSSQLSLDLLLRADDRRDTLQLIDVADAGRVIQEVDLASRAPFVIDGSAAGDQLTIDLTVPWSYAGTIEFRAGGGRDHVQIDAGHFDLLHLAKPDNTDLSALLVELGRNRMLMRGAETVEQRGSIASMSFAGANVADNWLVNSRGTHQLVIDGIAGSGSTMVLPAPQQRLALHGRGGDDRISLVDVRLDRIDVFVTGGRGNDAIELTRVDADRTNLSLSGGSGSDRLLLDQMDAARANIDMLGGADDDRIIVAHSSFDLSDLSLLAGAGHDHFAVDQMQLSRSDGNLHGGAGGDAFTLMRLAAHQSAVAVNGGTGDDRIAVTTIQAIQGAGLEIDGGEGVDLLQGPEEGASWHLVGNGTGTLAGHPYRNIEELRGSDTQSDAFVIGPQGDVEHGIHGGRSSGDSLTIHDRGFGPSDLVHSFAGPQGAVVHIADGPAHLHSGFELVAVEAEADSHSITLPPAANVTLTQNANGDLVTTVQFAFDSDMDLNQLDAADGVAIGGTDQAAGTSSQSVRRVGDVNADGIDDVIIGAPAQDRAYVVFGTATGFTAGLDVATLDGSNGFVLRGALGQNTGYSVGGGGDVNGDGIDDLIIGAPGPSDRFSAGTSYVVFGRPAFTAEVDLLTLDGTNGMALLGVADGDASGHSVAIVPDVNGDRIDDLVIGAPGADPDASRRDAGQAYLVMGSDQPMPAILSLADLDGVTGFALSGSSAGDQVGFAVDAAGDLNSDGLGDLVIGAPGADTGGTDAGAAYVLFGAGDYAVAEGLAGAYYDAGSITSLAEASAVKSNSVPTATFNAYKIDYPNSDDANTSPSSTPLSDFLGMGVEHLRGGDTATVGTSVFAFDGYLHVPEAGTYTFEVASSAGFSLGIDGQTVASFDGVRSFAATSGTHSFDRPGFYPLSLLYYSANQDSGIELKSDLSGTLDFVTREQLFTALPATTVELGSLDGHTGFTVTGPAAGDALGTAVGRVGDVNRDSADDVALGAPGSDAGGTDSGQVHLVYGKLLTTIDEGFAATMSAANLASDEGLTLTGVQAGGRVGGAVGGVGDVNADGAADLAIGAPGGDQQPGALYVVFGSQDLTAATNLGALDGVVGFTASLGQSGDRLGSSVAAAGDLTGDGLDDLIVRASDGARLLFGREVGGAATTISYSVPDSSFTIDGEGAGARVSIGRPPTLAASVEGQNVNENRIHVDGADIHISAHRITVEEGVVLSTRQIDADADPATAASLGDSGAIELIGSKDFTDEAGSVTVKSGAALYAQTEEGSEFEAGEILIKAHAGSAVTALLADQLLTEGGRRASISIADGTEILGGEIEIGTKAGINPVESRMTAAAGGIWTTVEGAINKYAALLSLPLSVQISLVESTVEIGTDGGEPVRIEGSEGVEIEAEAAADARGTALFWANPFSPGSAWGLAVGVWYADATSKITLHDQVTVESREGSVSIGAESKTAAGGAARVAQNLNQGISANDNTAPANPNNMAAAVGIGITNTTARVHVHQGASVIAELGNVSITTSGEDFIRILPETRSYKKGLFGLAFGFEESSDDIRTLVDGTVRAGGVRHGKEIEFNPFAAVDAASDAIDVGLDHGFKTGDELVYSPGLGGSIDGLERLGNYYAIVDEANGSRIRLAESREDAEEGISVDLRANPLLTSADGGRLQFTQVRDDTDWIDFGFAHGFSAGEALTYSAAPGKRVGGLSDGAKYYAVLVEGDDEGRLLRLAHDAAGTQIVDLNTDMTFTSQTTGGVRVVASIDETDATIMFTEPHGLSAGDAIEYQGALGFQLADGVTEDRFAPGTVFYAIPAPSDDDPTQLDPMKIRLAMSASDATSSNGYTHAIDLHADVSAMTGTEHALEPVTGSGITLSSVQEGEHMAESVAAIGGSANLVKSWTRPEFSSPALFFVQSLYSTLNDRQLDPPNNNQAPQGLNARTDQQTLNAAVGFIYKRVTRMVETIVGEGAVLQSGTEVAVEAEAEESGNLIAEGATSQTTDGGVKWSAGGAFAFATYHSRVRAIVSDGAVIDAKEAVEVAAETSYSFPAPIDSPDSFGSMMLADFEADPLLFVNELNTSFLYPLFTTGWAFASAKAENAFGFAVQYVSYDNVTEAIIADGARVNQTAEFRTDEQSVKVAADTSMHVVNMAGIFEFGLDLENLAAKANLLKRVANPLVEVGVEGKKVGVGTSFLWTDISNRTVAAVGGPSPVDDEGDPNGGDNPVVTEPAQVHTGAAGKLTVEADEKLWYFGFVDTGVETEEGEFAFAGSGSVLRYNHDGGEVTAKIVSGTEVTGGSVDVDAADSLVLVGQNGSFVTGNNTRGIGAGVNYWEINRQVRGFIGDGDGTTATGSSFELDEGSSIEVNASSDGFAVSFALAAATRAPEHEGEENGNEHGHVDSPVVQENGDDPAGNEIGHGENTGASGWSLAADASYIDLARDQVLAFIDDIGTFEAEEVVVSATNDNTYTNLTGAFAVVLPGFESKSNTGMAGSFSGMGLRRDAIDSLGRGASDTLAYIRRATIEAGEGGLALKSSRNGVYTMTAAGGSGVPRGEGIEVAGSAALNDLDYGTKAYVADGATLRLDGDSEITATDRVATIAIAGDAVWKGSLGFGTSWAWNNVDRRIHATIDDASITQTSGGLHLDAVLWDKAADDDGTLMPSNYAVAGTLGVGAATELSGTVAVNQLNADTSNDAVRTAITNSNYTSTAAGGEEVSLSSIDNSNLLAFAGGIDLGAEYTLGVAAAVNEHHHLVRSVIEGSQVDAGQANVSANAQIHPELNAFALGAQVTSQDLSAQAAGSGASNRVTATADAHIRGTVGPDGTSDTAVSASDVTVDAGIEFIDVTAGAGDFGLQIGVTSGAGLGAAVAVNDLSHVRSVASVDDAQVTADGAMRVAATTEMADGGVLLGLAVGLDGAASFALGGSVVSNTVHTETTAQVLGTALTPVVASSLSVSAEEKNIAVGAGSGQINAAMSQVNLGAVGASVATNTVDSTVTSLVEGAPVTVSGEVAVEADRKNAQIVSTAVGGDQAQSFALGGSVANNNVTHTTDAHVAGGTALRGDGGVSISANEDSPVIVAAAGNYTIANHGVAIGAAVPQNTIHRGLRAYVGNKNGDSFDSGVDGTSINAPAGTVTVDSSRRNSLILAIGVSGEGAESFSLGGSAATNDVQSSTVDAHAWGATLIGRDGVSVHATDTQATQAVGAGNVDISFLFQASGGNGGQGSQVNGRDFVDGNGQEAVDDQVGNDEVNEQQSNVENQQNGMQNENPVDEAQGGDDSWQSMRKNGIGSESDLLGAPGSGLTRALPQFGPHEVVVANDAPAGLGATAALSVGIALANNLAKHSTVTAFASDATLRADAGSIDVRAQHDALLVTVGGSGSLSQSGVALDTTEATTDYQPLTKAYIDAVAPDARSSVTAAGNVVVAADANLHAATIAGNAAYNASGTSVAMAVAVLNHSDQTQAYIDHADVAAKGNGAASSVATGTQLDKTIDESFRGVSVTATSKESVTTVAAGIEIGSTANNAAASVSVNALDETTTARVLEGATINASNADANAGQKVNVFAWSDTEVAGGGGAIGLSGGGTFGTGASSDAGSITKRTVAALDAGEVQSANSVSVQALSNEQLASYEGTVQVSKGVDIAATLGVHLFDLTTEARVGNGSQPVNLQTDGSLLVAADDRTKANYFAGSVAVSLGGPASVGASVGVVDIQKNTTAHVDKLANVIAKGLASTDAIVAAQGGFDATFAAATGDLTEVQPPGLSTNDLVGAGSSPTADEAYTKVRQTTPTRTTMHGVAVTATGRDVVKGGTFSAGGGGKVNVDTAALVRTGTTETAASIDGSVTADSGNPSDAKQDVIVTASHDYHQLAMAGALAAAGAVAVTPSVNWSAAHLTTEATIGENASVRSARDTHVVAKGSEHLTIVSAGFAASKNVAIDAQAAVDKLTSDVFATVSQGASVDADGNVVVSADDDTQATHVAGGAAIAVQPGASPGVGASVVYLDIGKTTTASIDEQARVDGRGNSTTTVSVLEGSVPNSGSLPTRSMVGVAVQAQSSENVQNYAVTGSGSVSAGVAGSVLYTHVHSDTNALVGDSAQINQRSGSTSADQSVSVAAANDASVTNGTGGLAGSILAFSGAVDVGIVRNNVTASLGQDAAVNAAKDIDVHAVARRDVESFAVSSADGVLGVNGSVSAWTIGKPLDSRYDTVSTSGNDALQLHSDTSTGKSPSYDSMGHYADGQADRRDISTAMGSYDADADGPAGSLLAANISQQAASRMNASVPAAEASQAIASQETASTTVQLLASTAAGSGHRAGGEIRVSSNERTHLNVLTGSVDGAALGFGASVGVSQVRGGAIAQVDARLNAAGDVNVTADATNHLNSEGFFAEAGLVADGAAVAVVEDHSVQQASLGDDAVIESARNVNVVATRHFDEFQARTQDVQLDAGTAGASVAQAKVRGSTHAFAGDVEISSSSTTPTVGDVTITATAIADPKAEAAAGAAGILAGDGNRADAIVTADVDAHFGGGGDAMANLSGDLAVTANSTAQPEAQGYGVAVGFITVGVTQTYATASPTVTAYVADNATVTLPGDGATAQEGGELRIEAITVENPVAHGRASGGGEAAGMGVDAQAFIQPDIKVYIGAGAHIDANLDVIVNAEDTWAGNAVAFGGDYGALAININTSKLTAKPKVTAFISADSVTSQRGAVSVTSLSGEPGSLAELDFDVARIDYNSNVITFNKPHGLETGDSLIYDSGGQGSVGGLVDGEAYLVYRVSDTQIKFVYQFDSADINPETGEIYSDAPHGIETGAPVVYDNSHLSDIPNLTGGHTYYVSAVDPHHLRLASTQEIADNLHESPFYRMVAGVIPPENELQMRTVFEGVGHHGHSRDGEHQIHIDDPPGWADGQAVYYFPSDGESIPELSRGAKYYVYSTDDHHNFFVSTDPEGKDRIGFSHDRQGNFVTATDVWRLRGEGIDSPESQFAGTQVDVELDQIVFTTAPPINHGDTVSIEYGSGGAFSFGYSEDLYYYADVTTSGGKTYIKLALTKDDLANHKYLDFDGSIVSDATYIMTRPFAVATGDALTYRQPLQVHFTDADIQNGKIVVQLDKAPTLFKDLIHYVNTSLDEASSSLIYDVESTFAGAKPIEPLTPGKPYPYIVTEEDNYTLTIEVYGITLTPSGDAAGTPVDHVLRMAGHDPIFGLEDNLTYYMIVDSKTPGVIKLARTKDDALNGHAMQFAKNPWVTTSNGTALEILAVDYVNDTVTVNNGASIGLAQPLAYHSVDDRWIIGLTGGQTYYAFGGQGTDTIRLASSAANAQAGIGIDLLQLARWVDEQNVARAFHVDEVENLFVFDQPTGWVTGQALEYQGIFGQHLVGISLDRTYYAVLPDPSDSTRIRVARSQEAALASDGYSNTVAFYVAGEVHLGDNGGTHFLGIEGIGIAPAPPPTGIQQLTIDLSDSGTTGTHSFVQANGTADVESISGRPTVRARGSNGNLFGGVGAQADAVIRPEVTAFVGDPAGPDTPRSIQIQAADFFLEATSHADLVAESIGFDVSVLAGGGGAFSTVNLFNTAETYVGVGTTIETTGDVTIDAVSSETVDAKMEMVAGGSVDIPRTEANVNVGRATTTTLGSGQGDAQRVAINAGGRTTIGATSATDGVVSGKAHAYGGLAIAVPHTNFKVGHDDHPAVTEVVLGDYVTIKADELTVSARANHSQLKSTANARTGELFGGSNVDAQMLVDDHARLTIGEHVASTTAHGKTVSALLSYDGADVTASSNAKSRMLVGGDYASARAELTGGAEINGQFTDRADDYKSYSATVTHPEKLEGRHESRSYYAWFIRDKDVGHNQSDTTAAHVTPSPAIAAVAVPAAQDAALADWSGSIATRRGSLPLREIAGVDDAEAQDRKQRERRLDEYFAHLA